MTPLNTKLDSLQLTLAGIEETTSSERSDFEVCGKTALLRTFEYHDTI
jgi:hypothetical protein